MSKLFFKSTDADLQKFQQSLSVLSKNVLYITHQVDFIRKKILEMETNKVLQKQVNDFYPNEEESEQV